MGKGNTIHTLLRYRRSLAVYDHFPLHRAPVRLRKCGALHSTHCVDRSGSSMLLCKLKAYSFPVNLLLDDRLLAVPCTKWARQNHVV